MVIIKRYSNRKLYNTETKQYITLEGVTRLIGDDQDIRVIDHMSGEDLTTFTLAQIITDFEKRESGTISYHFLTNLIRKQKNRLNRLHERQKTHELTRQLIDDEIRQRIQSLLSAGKLLEDDARYMIEMLVDHDFELPENAAIKYCVEKFLSDHQIPGKAELQSLLNTLDSLNNRLSNHPPVLPM